MPTCVVNIILNFSLEKEQIVTFKAILFLRVAPFTAAVSI
jgi:hypothetical protein